MQSPKKSDNIEVEAERKLSEIMNKLSIDTKNTAWLLTDLVEVSVQLYDLYSSISEQKADEIGILTNGKLKEIYNATNSTLNKNDRFLVKQLIKYWKSVITEKSKKKRVSYEIASEEKTRALINNEKYDEAITELDLTYKKNKDENNLTLAIQNLHDIGLVYYKKGDLKNALEYFEMAERNDHSYLLDVAYIHYRMKEYPKACQEYEEALKIMPKNKFAWNNAGWSFFEIDKNAKALQSFNKAIELGFDSWQPLAGKGATLCKIGKYKQAIEFLEKAVEKNPKHLGTLDQLTYLYSDCIFDQEKALFFARKAFELYPSAPIPRANIAEVLAKVGQFEEARQIAEKALSMHEGNHRITLPLYITLAYSHFSENNEQKGEEYLKRIYEEHSRLPKGFKRSWNYNGIEKAMNNQKIPEVIKVKLFDALNIAKSIPEEK